jgi:hypothetical protein
VRIPCPRCGYDLHGLLTGAGARCPECGGEFSLNEIAAAPRPISPAFIRKIALAPVIMGVCGAASNGLIAALPRSANRFVDALPIGTLLLPFLIGVIWVFAAERRAGILSMDRGTSPLQRALVRVCSLLLSLILTLQLAIPAVAVGYVLHAALAAIL